MSYKKKNVGKTHQRREIFHKTRKTILGGGTREVLTGSVPRVQRLQSKRVTMPTLEKVSFEKVEGWTDRRGKLVK